MLPEKLPSSLYEILKLKLSDVKVQSLIESGKEVPLLDEIEKLYDFAQAKEKVQLANADLTKQRDTWENEKKTISQSLKEKETEIETLKTSQLPKEELDRLLKLKEKGMTPDQEARFNTLESKLNDAISELTVEKTARTTAEKMTAEERRRAADETLKSEVLSGLSKVRINGNQADIALAALLAKGSVRLEQDDKGNYVRKFRIFEGGKELDGENLDRVLSTFAKQNEYLVAGTPYGGTGAQHQSKAPGASANERPSAMQMLKTFAAPGTQTT